MLEPLRTLPPRLWPLRPDFPGAARPSDQLFATTEDGLRLAIFRHRPARPGPAVILVHGLSANRYSFDFPGRSLAAYLAEQGFDAYVAELRGSGHSDLPQRVWDFDDYLNLDLPAIFQRVQRASGQTAVHWVGHSMGGMLMLCHAIRHGAPLQSGLALGSALELGGHGSSFEPFLRLRRVASRFRYVPFATAAQLLAPAMGRGGWSSFLERLNFAPGNAEPQVVRAVHGHIFGPLPVPLLLSLGTAFGPGGLRSRDGAWQYLSRAESCRIPVAMFGASVDAQCPPSALVETARRVGARRVEVFGTASGHAVEYGHFDLLLGRTAQHEVWPRVVEWLRTHA